MWYVANGVETLVHHNNLWALEAYKTITYETQNVREGISGLLDVTSSYCSGGFPAPAGTYKVLAPLASVGVLHAFVFSNFESHGDVFNSIDWSLGTTASPQATVRYTGPSVNDTYTHVTVYEEGWLDPRYQIITIPQGVYMSPNTEDFFSERLIPFQRNFIALSSNNKILKTNSGKIIIK